MGAESTADVVRSQELYARVKNSRLLVWEVAPDKRRFRPDHYRGAGRCQSARRIVPPSLHGARYRCPYGDYYHSQGPSRQP